MHNIKQVSVKVLLVLIGVGIASSVAYVKFLQMELTRTQESYAECQGAITGKEDAQASIERSKS